MAAHPTPSAPLPALPPRAPFCFPLLSDMLLLISDWPCYHRRLYLLFADFWTHPSESAPSCVPSTHRYTAFLCLLADPLGFEEPHLCIPVTARVHCWLDIVAVTARFLRCVCPTFPP
jgi:hypothetical protein